MELVAPFAKGARKVKQVTYKNYLHLETVNSFSSEIHQGFSSIDWTSVDAGPVMSTLVVKTEMIFGGNVTMPYFDGARSQSSQHSLQPNDAISQLREYRS